MTMYYEWLINWIFKISKYHKFWTLLNKYVGPRQLHMFLSMWVNMYVYVLNFKDVNLLSSWNIFLVIKNFGFQVFRLSCQSWLYTNIYLKEKDNFLLINVILCLLFNFIQCSYMQFILCSHTFNDEYQEPSNKYLAFTCLHPD